MIAYIVDNNHTLYKNNSNLIFTNLQNFILSNSKKKEYLYKTNFFSKKQAWDFSEVFFNEWYRNDKGKDIFKEKISFSKILNKFLFFSLLNDIKNYFALQEYSKKYSKIIIISSNKSIIRVSKYFKNLIIKKTPFVEENYIPATPERDHYFFFKNSISRKIIFKLDEYLLKNFKQNKIFLLKDWTSFNSLKDTKNILSLNSLNLKKSFYWNFNSNKKHDFSLNYDNVKFNYSYKIFKRFFKSDAEIINKLFINLFNKHYKSNIKFINQTSNVLINTFDIYNPIGFILFSNYDWLSILISEMCKMKDIKTFVLLDGYYVLESKMDFPKDENNIRHIFDYYFSYGPFFKKVLKDNKIKNKKIIDVKTPFLRKNKFKQKKLYDACILAYDPYIFNLNVTWDNQILIELSILNILQKLGYKNVLLKTKKSAKKKKNTQNKDILIYKKMFKKIYKKNLNLNLEIKSGEFSKIIEQCKLVIGGLSTAYVESCFHNVPYYVFEPEKNGINSKGLIISKKNISKLEKNLETNLLKKKWKKLDVEKLLVSKKLSEIKFKNYI